MIIIYHRRTLPRLFYRKSFTDSAFNTSLISLSKSISLPYSFSSASWNNLSFNSIAALNTLEIRLASAVVAVIMILRSISGLLPHRLIESRMRSVIYSFFMAHFFIWRFLFNFHSIYIQCRLGGFFIFYTYKIKRPQGRKAGTEYVRRK